MIDSLPRYEPDIFSDEAIANPYGHYRALRDLGPVVWLEEQGILALPRYDEVKRVLADDDTFASGWGIAISEETNVLITGTVVSSDGELHKMLRKVLAHRLTPKALLSIRDEVQALADDLVEALIKQEEFDAVSDLAQALPLSFVPDLIGWPQEQRENLLGWASAMFDLVGPKNARAERALPVVQEFLEFAMTSVEQGAVREGSMAADALAAVERGELEPRFRTTLMIDYMAPSLDTTLSAISSAIWLFGRNPDAWDMVRADSSLIPNAFNEVLRMETPIRAFTRLTTRETEIAGVSLPNNTRVLVIYGSANRDERHWDHPDEFDITRNAGEHLAFGHGVHTCAGLGLARIEAHSLLKALARRVERFELGDAEPKLNNIIRGFEKLPCRVRATA